MHRSNIRLARILYRFTKVRGTPSEAWHQEVACNPTASVVVAGGRGGITVLEKGVDGRRLLFPEHPIDALAFTK